MLSEHITAAVHSILCHPSRCEDSNTEKWRRLYAALNQILASELPHAVDLSGSWQPRGWLHGGSERIQSLSYQSCIRSLRFTNMKPSRISSELEPFAPHCSRTNHQDNTHIQAVLHASPRSHPRLETGAGIPSRARNLQYSEHCTRGLACALLATCIR